MTELPWAFGQTEFPGAPGSTGLLWIPGLVELPVAPGLTELLWFPGLTELSEPMVSGFLETHCQTELPRAPVLTKSARPLVLLSYLDIWSDWVKQSSRSDWVTLSPQVWLSYLEPLVWLSWAELSVWLSHLEPPGLTELPGAPGLTAGWWSCTAWTRITSDWWSAGPGAFT